MPDPEHSKIGFPDAVQLFRSFARVAESSQRLVLDFLTRAPEFSGLRMADRRVGEAFLELTAKMLSDPVALARAQIDLWTEHARLWTTSTQRLFGLADHGPDIGPPDARFRHPAWSEVATFDYIKQSYIITAESVLSTVRGIEGLDKKTARKVDFYTRQFVDAIAPSNFIATNPEVLKATLESGGRNLLNGLANLLRDIDASRRTLSITMSDLDAFRVGETIAATPGKVIFQNEMMQLIQYSPLTDEVRRVPLLIVPPWINKFYVLDLRPQNSFIRWAVAQGHTVFVISWVNPDARLAEKSFEDYMLQGPIAALDVLETTTGEREVNLVGYCLGGTLLAATLAYLADKGDTRAASATYFATLVDFTDVGDMAVFIDEEQLKELEARMRDRGYLEAHEMAMSFNMLRANDLIWSFVVNNYLLGKEPLPFDVLYWNADATRMPAAMHSFYLRNMYHENRLAMPGGITLAGARIDLRKVEVPSFFLSTREDHIAPWRTTYAGTQLFSGPVTFVLAASGHIAGVVSPPGSKYGHWQNPHLPTDPTNGFTPPRPPRAHGGRSGISGSWASRRAWWTHANPVAGSSSQLRTRPAPTFGCVQGGDSHRPDPKFESPTISRAKPGAPGGLPYSGITFTSASHH